jgi:hypothetical protein
MIKNKLTKEVQQLYKPPKNEIDYPSIQVPDVAWMQEIDVLHLPSDNGYCYLLCIVDVFDSSCDCIALKTLEKSNMMKAIQHLYDNSMYLLKPKLIQADREFNCNEFKNWCDENEINYKFTVPNRHRQNAHVERLCKTLGTWIWQLQVVKEIETKKPNTEWVNVYRELIKILNDNHKKRKQKERDDNIILNKNNNVLIAPNTKVRLMIPDDEPQDIQGNKLHGKLRAADHKWKYSPIYAVLYPMLKPGQPPLYRIKNDKTNKEVEAFYTAEQLSVI